MKSKIFAFLSVAAVAMTALSAVPVAQADGMPFKNTNPDKPAAVTPPPAESASPAAEAPVNVTPIETVPSEVVLQEPAQESLPAPPPVPDEHVAATEKSGYFGLSLGMYDPFSHGQHAASVNFEWQPGFKVGGILQPLVGAFATSNGAIMGYAGLGLPIDVSESVTIMPSFALGAYEGGNGVDLRHVFAYRVGTEIAYKLQDDSRIGLNLHMIGNGRSMGARDRTEVIGINYTMPLHAKVPPAPPVLLAPAPTPSMEAPPASEP